MNFYLPWAELKSFLWCISSTSCPRAVLLHLLLLWSTVENLNWCITLHKLPFTRFRKSYCSFKVHTDQEKLISELALKTIFLKIHTAAVSDEFWILRMWTFFSTQIKNWNTEFIYKNNNQQALKTLDRGNLYVQQKSTQSDLRSLQVECLSIVTQQHDIFLQIPKTPIFMVANSFLLHLLRKWRQVLMGRGAERRTGERTLN